MIPEDKVLSVDLDVVVSDCPGLVERRSGSEGDWPSMVFRRISGFVTITSATFWGFWRSFSGAVAGGVKVSWVASRKVRELGSAVDDLVWRRVGVLA